MTDLLKELEAVVAMIPADWDWYKCKECGAKTSGDPWPELTHFIRTHHAEIAEALADARTEREMQNAADKLPDGYSITIYVEKGSGYIDLTDPDGDPVHVDTDDRNMAQQIAEATRAAAIDAHNSAREVGE